MSAPTLGRAAQILLPFAEKEYVDLPRVGSILGVSLNTVYRLRAWRDEEGRPALDTIDYGSGKLQRVLYSSLVAFCDRLRVEYQIPDRRPALDNPMLRHRDEDLLPFPLADTMTTVEALGFVAYADPSSMRDLIEEGAFHAYRLIPEESWRWRISRTDFARWLQESRNRVRSR